MLPADQVSLCCTCHAHRWVHKLTLEVYQERTAGRHLRVMPATFPWTHTLEPRPAWAAPLDTLPAGRKEALPGVGPLHCTPNKSPADKKALKRNPSLFCHQINREERETPSFSSSSSETYTGLPQASAPSPLHLLQSRGSQES